MEVDLSQTTLGVIFNFICYGNLNKKTNLLLRGNKVNQGIKFVCPSEQLRIAYNTYLGILELDDFGKMVDFGYKTSIADIRPAEILSPFLNSQNLKPVWTDCNGDYGTFNKSTGKAESGVVAEVYTYLSCH